MRCLINKDYLFRRYTCIHTVMIHNLCCILLLWKLLIEVNTTFCNVNVLGYIIQLYLGWKLACGYYSYLKCHSFKSWGEINPCWGWIVHCLYCICVYRFARVRGARGAAVADSVLTPGRSVRAALLCCFFNGPWLCSHWHCEGAID